MNVPPLLKGGALIPDTAAVTSTRRTATVKPMGMSCIPVFGSDAVSASVRGLGAGLRVASVAADPLLSLSSDTDDDEDTVLLSASVTAPGALVDVADESYDDSTCSLLRSSSSTYLLELVLYEVESLLLDIGQGVTMWGRQKRGDG